MAKVNQIIPPDLIGTQEITERLNLSDRVLSRLRNERFSTMPKPVNDDPRYYLYAREPMLEWIDHYLQMEKISLGLDNKMAQDFIRRPAPFGSAQGTARSLSGAEISRRESYPQNL